MRHDVRGQVFSGGQENELSTGKKLRLGLYLTEKHDISHSIELARLAERSGFESVWQGEEYPPFTLARDSIIPLAAIAAVTKSIKLGTGVLHTWTRNVMTLAMSFATLDDLSNGRSMLGMGVLWEPMATMMGIVRKDTLKAMREHVEALHALFSMKTVNVDGEFVKLQNVHLLKKPISIPIYIGATGFNMLELAGEIADGVLMNYLISPDYNRKALEFLSRGAAKVGRKLDDLDRPQLVACFMDEDVDKAMNSARLMLTEYLFTQPHIMKACGVKPDVLENIHEILGSWPPEPAKADRLQEALALVDDDLVRSVCAVGTSEDCKRKVRDYVAAGSTCPLICPLTGHEESTIEAFSSGY